MEIKKKILVVEDEKNISDILTFNLQKEGYDVDAAFDGENGLKMITDGEYDIVLLDVMLPMINGFDVLRMARESTMVPIIMLTAKEEEVDKVLGLDLGADDYITKPFSVRELMYRIKANIRRYSNEKSVKTDEKSENDSKPGCIIIGEITLNTDMFEVFINGEKLEISLKEYEFMKLTMQNPGKVFSREELLKQVWGYGDFIGEERVVDVMVSRLRKKMDTKISSDLYIHNRRGAGYYFSYE